MELPLFPLNTVLFPGAALPLHVFEDRYRRMIAACLSESSPFGALLIRKGSEVGGPAEPFHIGTTANIVRVQRLDQGRMNLLCAGGKRFRVLKILRQEPYLLGEVDLLQETVETSGETRELADTVSALFAEYVRLYLAVTNQWSRTVGMPGDPGLLADFIGSRLNVSLWTKQRILEELSAHKRLEIEVHVLGEAVREMAHRVHGTRTLHWRGFGVMN